MNPKHAARLLRINSAMCLRSVLAGFVGIAQILRLVDLVSLADTEHRARVMACKEPMVQGCVEGRVVRFTGQTSNVTELTAEKYEERRGRERERECSESSEKREELAST